MDTQTSIFQANLLYSETPGLGGLLEKLRDTIEDHGVVVRQVERSDDASALITCDLLRVLVARSRGHVYMEQFLAAERPAAAQIGRREILSRLSEHACSLTILVLGPDDDGADTDADLACRVCWDLADCLIVGGGPTLIYWDAGDTLYSAEEFRRANAFLASQGGGRGSATGAGMKAAQARAARVLRDQANAWIRDPIGPDRQAKRAADFAEGTKTPRLGAALASWLPVPSVLAQAGLLAGLNAHRAINGLAMTCASATIGISGFPILGL